MVLDLDADKALNKGNDSILFIKLGPLGLSSNGYVKLCLESLFKCMNNYYPQYQFNNKMIKKETAFPLKCPKFMIEICLQSLQQLPLYDISLVLQNF